jgi:hypothetical protein
MRNVKLFDSIKFQFVKHSLPRCGDLYDTCLWHLSRGFFAEVSFLYFDAITFYGSLFPRLKYDKLRKSNFKVIKGNKHVFL